MNWIIISLVFSAIFYLVLLTADFIAERIMRAIEKRTGKSLEDHFLPWYDEEA